MSGMHRKGSGALWRAGALAVGMCNPSMALELMVEGTGDGMDIIQSLARATVQSTPNDRIQVPPSVGSGGGIAKVLEGGAEMARAARALSPAETQQGLSERIVFFIPVAFIVNRDTGISELTSEALAKVFSGEVKNWREIGGNDLPIRVFTREPDDSSRQTLEKTLPGWQKITLAPKRREISTTTQDLAAAVKYSPGAIGYAPNSKWLGDTVRVIRVNGVGVESPHYPSANVIRLVWREGRLSALGQRFLDFVKSREAAAIIKERGGRAAD